MYTTSTHCLKSTTKCTWHKYCTQLKHDSVTRITGHGQGNAKLLGGEGFSNVKLIGAHSEGNAREKTFMVLKLTQSKLLHTLLFKALAMNFLSVFSILGSSKVPLSERYSLNIGMAVGWLERWNSYGNGFPCIILDLMVSRSYCDRYK